MEDPTLQDAEDFSGGVFEDEDTRTFYEVLPDLRFLVPGAVIDAASTETVEGAADAAHAQKGSAPEDGQADEAEDTDAAADVDDQEASDAAGMALFGLRLHHLILTQQKDVVPMHLERDISTMQHCCDGSDISRR